MSVKYKLSKQKLMLVALDLLNCPSTLFEITDQCYSMKGKDYSGFRTYKFAKSQIKQGYIEKSGYEYALTKKGHEYAKKLKEIYFLQQGI